jgi:predicted nucleotidyltransferase
VEGAPEEVFKIIMAKNQKDPKAIFPEITDAYKALFGDDLVSIILYGSAAGQDFRPGKSDINFMIVLTEDGIEHLDQAFDVVNRWRKRGVAVPLFLTEEYVKTSLDVFPVEYLNFQNNYVRVFGKDILENLEFNPEFIRLQCEREIKGKLLLLREAFLETSGRGKALKGVIRQALPALMAIFEALLHLKEIDVPRERREIVRTMADAFDLDHGVFEGLLEIKEEKSKISDKESLNLFKGCLREMRKLSKLIDSLGG